MNFNNILVCGSSHVAFNIAQYIYAASLPVVVLECKISSASTMEYLCRKYNIPFQTLHREEMTRVLVQYAREPVLIINAVNYYIFPPEIVENPNAVLINYHNAILPAHRGMNSEAWQIYEMDDVSGITWHYIVNELDAGPIITQEKIVLGQTVTSLELLKKHNQLAFQSFIGFFDDLLKSNIQSFPQSEPQNKTIKRAKDIPGNGILDTTWSASKIYAFLRSMDYGPLHTLGRPALFHNEKRYVWKKYGYRSTSYNREENQVTINDNFIEIKCNEAELLLYKPQIAVE